MTMKTIASALGMALVLGSLGTTATEARTRKVVVLSALALWWSWGLLAFVIIAVDALLPFSAAQLGRRIAAHVVLSFVFTSLLVYVLVAMRALLGEGVQRPVDAREGDPQARLRPQ